METRRFAIVGIGEALYDIFPDGKALGGAPLNAVVHAVGLGESFGVEGLLISRVGQDPLGEEMVQSLESRGVNRQLMQFDPDLPTGRVYVDVDREGNPQYEIVENVAWDNIQFDFDLEDIARECHAITFGSLAQRFAQTRNTIYRFLDSARRTIKLFDVNLRGDYYSRELLHASCNRANIVKLNHEELPIVCRTLRLAYGDQDDPTMLAALADRYELDLIVYTRGKQGTALFTAGNLVEGEQAGYERTEGADSVGAGDSVTAAVLLGRLLRRDPQQIATFANHVGAYVASQPGAVPNIPEDIRQMIR